MLTLQVTGMGTSRNSCPEKSDGEVSDSNGANNEKTCCGRVIWQQSGKSNKLQSDASCSLNDERM